MNPNTIKKQSKRLSWLLRHGAIEAGLPMDAAGFARVDDVLRIGRLSRAQLDAIIALNDKQRLELVGDRVRANQGHSLDGTPVTVEALEASWTLWEGREPIWHGTVVEAVFGIAKGGIEPRARSHVHLASSVESKVGKRWNTPVLLGADPERVRAAGYPLYASPNGVILARFVPASAIVALQVRSKRAQAAEAEMRAALGL
ncbi:MAG: RNA 2'-phosphotransferase [Alphaproteobacteria bacterium]|nr:RNA 2'-phosphotransferase [Alphaproteobacteria bacterium]